MECLAVWRHDGEPAQSGNAMSGLISISSLTNVAACFKQLSALR